MFNKDSTGVAEETEIDQKDKDTGPEYLIPLQHILTSVTPEVLDWNNLLLMICGPVVLIILVIVITISYLPRRNNTWMSESRLMQQNLLKASNFRFSWDRRSIHIKNLLIHLDYVEISNNHKSHG
ncbi:uncharacterized protein ACNLHF_020424 [Anomaloglossus baeobatrachus]